MILNKQLKMFPNSLKPISTSKSPEVGDKSRPVLLYIKVGKEDNRRVRGQED